MNHEFPVLAEGERAIGVLTRDNIITALKRRPSLRVTDIMHRDLPVVSADAPFDELFRRMQEAKCPALPVVDKLGRFLGLITLENIGELMLVNTLQPRGGKASWRTG